MTCSTWFSWAWRPRPPASFVCAMAITNARSGQISWPGLHSQANRGAGRPRSEGRHRRRRGCWLLRPWRPEEARTPSRFPAGAGAKPKSAGAGHDGQAGPSKAHSFLDAAHGPAKETWAHLLLVELLRLL